MHYAINYSILDEEVSSMFKIHVVESISCWIIWYSLNWKKLNILDEEKSSMVKIHGAESISVLYCSVSL